MVRGMMSATELVDVSKVSVLDEASKGGGAVPAGVGAAGGTVKSGDAGVATGATASALTGGAAARRETGAPTGWACRPVSTVAMINMPRAMATSGSFER